MIKVSLNPQILAQHLKAPYGCIEGNGTTVIMSLHIHFSPYFLVLYHQ